MRPEGFVVVLPVKSPGSGKSRLATLTAEERTRLAAAFARDAVVACLSTPSVVGVLVVSDDPGFAAELAALGAATCADPGDGLNAALRRAAARARETWPDAQPVALCADVPALRAAELALALARARSDGGAWFVRDADGTGTTLYTAAYDAFDPRFGPGSAAAHAAAGAVPVPGDLPGLRRDVDDARTLAAAVDLGVGAATAAALPGRPSGPAADAGRAALPEESGPIS